MGAVLVWITQHSKQLLAWSAFVLALGSLLVAVSGTGVADKIGNSIDAAVDTVEDTVSAVTTAIDNLADEVESLLFSDTSGWTECIWYTLALDTLATCVLLVSTSFAGLLAVVVAGLAASATIGFAVWVYVKAVSLARAISTGEIRLKE